MTWDGNLSDAADENEAHDDIPVTEMEEHGLLQARSRASAIEILRSKYAVVDYLSFAQCARFVGSSFNEVQHIWRDLQVQRAGAYGNGL